MGSGETTARRLLGHLLQGWGLLLFLAGHVGFFVELASIFGLTEPSGGGMFYLTVMLGGGAFVHFGSYQLRVIAEANDRQELQRAIESMGKAKVATVANDGQGGGWSPPARAVAQAANEVEREEAARWKRST